MEDEKKRAQYERKKEKMREYSKKKYQTISQDKNSDEYKRHLEYCRIRHKIKSDLKKQEKLDFMQFINEKRRLEAEQKSGEIKENN